MLFEAGGNSSEVLELAEEAFDEISEAIQERAERWDIDASWHRLDVGPGAAIGHGFAQAIAIVGSVAEEYLAFDEAVEHVGGAFAVMSLAFRQLHIGLPLASTRAWILVVSPPRERPMQLVPE
jgi:hypothetical protein